MEIKKNKNKNATQDFRDFSVGRERANKQFFFLPYDRQDLYAWDVVTSRENTCATTKKAQLKRWRI